MECDGLDPLGSRGGSTLLKEELSVGSVGKALQGHGAVSNAPQGAVGDGEVELPRRHAEGDGERDDGAVLRPPGLEPDERERESDPAGENGERADCVARDRETRAGRQARGGVDLMPDLGTRPVNKYLPPRPKDRAPTAPALEPVADGPQGFLGWLDRALARMLRKRGF